MQRFDVVKFVVGSAIIAFGAGTLGVSAFQADHSGVFIGALLFVAGFEISQYSEPWRREIGIERMFRRAQQFDLTKTGSLLLGAVAVTHGFVLLAQGINATALLTTLGAAVLIFVGYALMHLSVNHTLV